MPERTCAARTSTDGIARAHGPDAGDGQLRVSEGMIANESPVRSIRTLGSTGGGRKRGQGGDWGTGTIAKAVGNNDAPPTLDWRGTPRLYSGRAMLPQRWYAERVLGELLRLLDHLGGVQGVLLGGGIAWILFELRSQRARAKEDREAADRLFRKSSEDAERLFCEFRGAADTRAQEDCEAADNRAREDRESIRVLLREDSDKNSAEHARLFALLEEVKTNVEVLLDRSNRPGGGGSAD